MNKPASVAIKEFSDNIEKCINDSGLPPIIIELTMRGYYLQIKEMADRQTRSEEKLYLSSAEETEK